MLIKKIETIDISEQDTARVMSDYPGWKVKDPVVFWLEEMQKVYPSLTLQAFMDSTGVPYHTFRYHKLNPKAKWRGYQVMRIVKETHLDEWMLRKRYFN